MNSEFLYDPTQLYPHLSTLCTERGGTWKGTHDELEQAIGFDVSPMELIALEMDGLISVQFLGMQRKAISIVERGKL